MFERKALRWPVTLGVVMIILLVVLTVGWVLLSVYGAKTTQGVAALYWTLLPVGATFLVLVLVGVVIYLTLSIKAIRLNQRQSNFIDSVTHELKSPLASLKLYLQTLRRRPMNLDEQTVFFSSMLEDVERLDQLINQLLDTARLEKGPLEADLEDVDLAKLLRDCAESVALRYRVGPEVISLNLRPCTVRGRLVDLDMIFRNLIDNALKYAGMEPQVEVVLRPLTDGNIQIDISDNGRGIPTKDRRRVFGRFVRLGSELQRDRPGTGLGLYIVRTLVTRLKGRVRVKGREPGPGTIFEVQLPGHLRPTVDIEPAGTAYSEAAIPLVPTEKT